MKLSLRAFQFFLLLWNGFWLQRTSDPWVRRQQGQNKFNKIIATRQPVHILWFGILRPSEPSPMFTTAQNLKICDGNEFPPTFLWAQRPLRCPKNTLITTLMSQSSSLMIGFLVYAGFLKMYPDQLFIFFLCETATLCFFGHKQTSWY